MRYIIGIDLGTTNSSVSYVDTFDSKGEIRQFKPLQLIREGTLGQLPSLPSCCYLASPVEFRQGALDLPWASSPDFFVGQFALDLGGKVPTRLVQSAKSWLCHPAANRRDKILPVEAANDEVRISPLEATSRYLRHIREAWNHQMAKGEIESELEAQEVVLTVPASFDEVARSLTVEAAKLAGFHQMTLLEEPQAAFYSWISRHEHDWQQLICPGTSVLVCDVGGGTTDFSLIEVVEKGGELAFQRMAVGDHLLLGGDNMDATLANQLEEALVIKGAELSLTQRLQLRHEARRAKEALLIEESRAVQGSDSYRVVLQGAGSHLVRGALSCKLEQSDVKKRLKDGFFSRCSLEEALTSKAPTGIRTMGLAYESEPSITKHLARFLSAAAGDDKVPKKPDYVLFNGGVMKPSLFQEGVMNCLSDWFPEKTASILPSFNLDLAVACGAAYYGKVRRGNGVRIGGGAARGIYLILEAEDSKGNVRKKALTLLPRGCEEGDAYEPLTTFYLTPNVPVSFQLSTSHVRLHDVSGDLIEIDQKEMQMLPPIQTVLRFGKQKASDNLEKLPVHIQIGMTPIGTIQIGLKSLKSDHHWSLEFQLRSAKGQDNRLAEMEPRKMDETFSSGYLKEAELLIQAGFSDNGSLPIKIMEQLEELFQSSRKDFPPSTLRGLADVLLKISPQRKLSKEHGTRWWNLIGFFMRPGFGYPLDDFRIKELWKVCLSDFKAAQIEDISIQMWICYRRISGGLGKGQQMQLAQELMAQLLPKKTTRIEIKNQRRAYPVSEIIRSLGSFELIDTSVKVRLGEALLSQIRSGSGSSADFWSLGRIGARHLLYGSLVNVLPVKRCEEWINSLLHAQIEPNETLAHLFGQIARKTDYPEINVSETTVAKILSFFSGTAFQEPLQELLKNPKNYTESERDHAFGEHLPSGLLLYHEEG